MNQGKAGNLVPSEEVIAKHTGQVVYEVLTDEGTWYIAHYLGFWVLWWMGSICAH